MVQFISIIAILWIIIIFLSNRIDVSKKGIYIAPGLLIWEIGIIKSLISKISGIKRINWNKFGDYSIYIGLIIFFSLPIILLANLILISSGINNGLIPSIPITFINPEILILIVLPLFISLALNMIMQAILSVNEGKEIEKIGFMVIGFVFFPFFKIIDGTSTSSSRLRMKIITGAALINVIVGLAFTPVIYHSDALSSTLYEDPDGALVLDVIANGRGFTAGIKRGDVITQIKYQDQSYITQITEITNSRDFVTALRTIDPGTSIIIRTQKADLSVNTAKNVEMGSTIHIYVDDYLPPKIKFMSPFLPFWLDFSIFLFVVLNIFIGVYNLLPLPFSEGQQILEIVTKNIDTEENLVILKKAVIVISSILFVLNVILTM